MAYYTRKPEFVEAIQWTGDNLQEIVDFVGEKEHIQIAFKNPKLDYRICFIDLEGYTGDETNIVMLYIGPLDICPLRINDYLVLHDYGETDIFAFEAIPDYKFKVLYQSDSCSLDGSGCE